MTRSLRLLTLGVSIGACIAVSGATPLNIRPGLWEVVRVTEQSAATQISPERVGTLTPEQRKELEETFPERVPGRREVHQTCITSEQLSLGFLPEDNPECKRTTLESTDTTFAVRMECLDSLGARTTELHLKAMQNDTVNGDVEGNIKGASGKVAHFKVAITARWLQEDCKKHEPG
jgi:hypothetical protein